MAVNRDDARDGARTRPAAAPSGIRVVGGSRDFLAATGLGAQHDAPFEEALTLARLVLDHDGGPVPLTGRRAPFKAPVLRALARRGWVDLIGDSLVTPQVRVTSAADLRRAGGGWTASTSSAAATEKTGWRAAASDEGHRLVAAHLARSQAATPTETPGQDPAT